MQNNHWLLRSKFLFAKLSIGLPPRTLATVLCNNFLLKIVIATNTSVSIADSWHPEKISIY